MIQIRRPGARLSCRIEIDWILFMPHVPVCADKT
jgi:hypothetical protein